MAASIQLPAGQVATVEFGRWKCPAAPWWADALNAQNLDSLAQLTRRKLDYFPDTDNALAQMAAEFYGGQVLSINPPADIPPGVVA